MATIIPEARTQFLDSNGDPLVNGTVTSFVPGTDTAKNTWDSPQASAVNPNPVVLDAAGRGSIFGDGSNYRQVVRDRFGNLIWDRETGIPPTAGVGAINGVSLLIEGSGHITGGLQIEGNALVGATLTVGDALNVTNTASFGGGITVNGPNSAFTQGLVVDNEPGQTVALEVDGGHLLVTNNRIICSGDNSPSFIGSNTIDGTHFGMWNANSRLEFGTADQDGNPTGLLAYHDGGQLFVFGNVNVTGGFFVNGVPHVEPIGLAGAPDGQYLMTKRGAEVSVVAVEQMPSDRQGRRLLFVR